MHKKKEAELKCKGQIAVMPHTYKKQKQEDVYWRKIQWCPIPTHTKITHTHTQKNTCTAKNKMEMVFGEKGWLLIEQGRRVGTCEHGDCKD
jgi:hypothetical protein